MLKNTFAALLLALAAFVASWIGAHEAQAQRTGPYMLVAHSNQTTNVGIFRIDTSSGAVSFCSPEGPPNALTVHCTASTLQ